MAAAPGSGAALPADGRYYEDFVPGDIYRHWPGRTLSETDNTWFTLLTMNTHPLHFDAEYASKSEYGRIVVNSCLTPIAHAQGASITTIEGAATGKTLHEVQAAFLEHGGAQCGICTPGMVLAAHELLSRIPEPTEDDVRAALAGNLCRCTGYMRIFEAVLEAAQRQ